MLRLLTIWLITVVFTFAFTVHVKPLNTTEGKQSYVAQELVVKFHSAVPSHAIERFNSTHGATIIKELPFGISLLQLPEKSSPIAMAAIYEKNPNVQFAHPNYIAYTSMIPNDTFYQGYQWNFDNPTYGGIAMEEAWDEGNAGIGVTVAVLDTGIAHDLSDLTGTSFTAGYDFINNDADPYDDEGHGTHVAGTIAQTTNNSEGVAGVAYNATLMAVKVLGADGSGSSVSLIDGINYAINNNADIINMSLGFSRSVTSIASIDTALQAAADNGIVIVAASGNDGYGDFVSYPARNINVIAVGATDYYENVTSYSNKGAQLDITAPGGDNSQNLSGEGYGYGGVVQQTIGSQGIGYYYYQGTSMATPHVAAVAALIKEANGLLTPQEVRTILHNSAEDHGATGWDSSYGHGIVDAYNAVLLAKANNNPNTDPVALITGTTSGEEDTQISLSAGTSYDDDGDTLTYTWDIDGIISYGENVSKTFSWGGSFLAKLTVDDGRGGVSTTTETITITEVNDLPVVDIGGPYNAITGVEIKFDASGTTDYDNEDGTTDNDQTLSYSWDLGDGNAAIGVMPTHTYTQEGEYLVTLSVSDGVGEVQEVSTTVIVQDIQTTFDQLAVSDIFVSGNVLGSYTNTHLADGINQTISEIETGGRPNNRYSYLEHQWQFNIQNGDILTLNINARANESTETYTFAYSTDGTSYIDILTVNSSDSLYSASLPNTLSGIVYIRVKDNGRTSGNRTVHSISIDQLFIRTETSQAVTTLPLAPTNLVATANSFDSVTLTWSDNSDNESGFVIERSTDNNNWSTLTTTSANTVNFLDTGLTALTLYYYRVWAINALGTSSYILDSVTTLEEPATVPIELLSAQKTQKGPNNFVDLTWSVSATVEIYRNGSNITETTGTLYSDKLGKNASGDYIYKVCYAGTLNCSNEIVVSY